MYFRNKISVDGEGKLYFCIDYKNNGDPTLSVKLRCLKKYKFIDIIDDKIPKKVFLSRKKKKKKSSDNATYFYCATYMFYIRPKSFAIDSLHSYYSDLKYLKKDIECVPFSEYKNTATLWPINHQKKPRLLYICKNTKFSV